LVTLLLSLYLLQANLPEAEAEAEARRLHLSLQALEQILSARQDSPWAWQPVVKIEQRVYPDTKPTALYDDENAERLWVHTVSSEDWEVNNVVVLI
jgi:hypothetical protein